MATLTLDPDLDEDLHPTQTRWKKGEWRMPTAKELKQATHPTVANRLLSWVGWHTPEIVTGAVLATGGGLVWGPAAWLGVVPAAVTATRHGVDRVRSRRRQTTSDTRDTRATGGTREVTAAPMTSGALDWPAEDPDDETVTQLHRGSA